MRTQILSTCALLLCSLLFESSSAWSAQNGSRRGFLKTAGGIALTVSLPVNAVDSSLLDDLKASKAKLEPIPGLLANEEWEAVRQILKTPPVNKLWNLGDVSSCDWCLLRGYNSNFKASSPDSLLFLTFLRSHKTRS
jgi:hypothetical protein